MALRVGCDIVCISRFRGRLEEGGPSFVERIFLPVEFVGKSPQQLAGIFAAKEAVCKALACPPGHWLEMAVEHLPSGAPNVALAGTFPGLEELSVSISHDGDYATSFAIARFA